MVFGFRRRAGKGMGSGKRNGPWPWVLFGLALAACVVDDASVGPGKSTRGNDAGANAAQGGEPADGNGGQAGDRNAPAAGSSGSPGGASNPGGGANAGGAGGANDAMGGESGAGPLVPATQPCLYFEADDEGNDQALPATGGSAEVTGQSSDDKIEICGRVDADHYAASEQIVDIDTYSFDIAEPTGALISAELFGALEADRVELVVSTSSLPNQRVRASDNNAIYWGKLPAGKVEVSLVVMNGEALTKPLSYMLHMRPLDVESHCKRGVVGSVTGTDQESGDGASNSGNDFIRPVIGQELQTLTPDATDNLEDATHFGIDVGDVHLLRGSMAEVAHAGEPYTDGDAWAFDVGFVPQITIRLDWEGANTDLDMYVFESGDLRPSAIAQARGNTKSEALTIATDFFGEYWLWVGAFGTSVDLPMAYDITICAEHFLP
jgi:hypothetical protein